jgi:hypothetical protein
MTIRLIWVEQDRRGKVLGQREELICGDSIKRMTRSHVATLINRYHPELQFAGRMTLFDASETPYKWFLRADQLDSNRWVYVYADTVADGTSRE